MAELPAGTVTFLFTDIEGSTRLLKRTRELVEDELPSGTELRDLGEHRLKASTGPSISSSSSPKGSQATSRRRASAGTTRLRWSSRRRFWLGADCAPACERRHSPESWS